MNIKKNLLPFLLCLSVSGLLFLQAQAQTVTVTPVEYPDGMKNPFMGFRPGFIGTSKPNWKNEGPYPTLFRHYIKWEDLENAESDGVQKIINFCNTQWAGAEQANVRIIPRLILQWTDTYYYPADIPDGDYASQKIKDRVRRMIQRLGQVWDNDPRVAWIQTGIIGKWGEQESPVNVRDNNNEWVKIIGAEFQAAFPNKLKVVRNQQYWDQEGYDWGVYWDSFAHTGQYTGAWSNIKTTNTQGRWVTDPIEGEVAYDWGDGRSNFAYPNADPTKAWNVNSTVQNPPFYNFIINTIKQLHCSSLGWVDGYTKTDPTCLEGASQIQKAFGYRFVITTFSCSRQTAQGGTLNLNFKVKNVGSAPILAPVLENWQLAFTLINETTRQIVWTAPLPVSTNIRNWLPGDNYDWDPNSNPNGTKTYLNPAVEHVINTSVTVPSGIATGQYLAGITILDPSTQKPGVFFAVKNFFKESQAQPLCRIGIGQDLSGSTDLSPTLFNDLVKDDARSYVLTPGTTYTLSTTATNGSVARNPSGVAYGAGLSVILTATANSGYIFSGWSGDLSGSTNPATLTMNANKSVTANFTPGATPTTYTLTANATNGSISPTSGSYNAGTSVTLTATPNNGYTFSGWSGDLSGSTNPATLTMNANKSVTANFVVNNATPTPKSGGGGALHPGFVALLSLLALLRWHFKARLSRSAP